MFLVWDRTYVRTESATQTRFGVKVGEHPLLFFNQGCGAGAQAILDGGAGA